MVVVVVVVVVVVGEGGGGGVVNDVAHMVSHGLALVIQPGR